MRRFINIVSRLGLAGWTCAACVCASPNALSASAETVSNGPPEATAVPDRLSANAAKVIRLVESGVEEDVVLTYIKGSPTPFGLSAEDIIYLKDLGISAPIISAMLHQDSVVRDQPVQAGGTTGTTNQLALDQKPSTAPTNVPPATPPVYVTNAPPDVDYFYHPLEPYGTWIDLEGYGWGWQPQVVVINRSWQPYCHGGKWLYTDSGWYWQSEYSWGWAPFHYGRWHQHPRCGWVWFPDRVWGPAWVCWRYSDAHCGWAPLPPGAHFVAGHGFRFNNASVGVNFDFGLSLNLFTFVEIGHLHEPHPYLHSVPPARVREVYNHTTVVNNYFVRGNNHVVNQGIAVDRVAAASHTEIRPVTIRDAPAMPGKVIRPDRVEKVGSTTVLYRPELKTPVKPGPVVAQKIDERNPVVRSMPRQLQVAVPSAREQPTGIKSGPSPSPGPTGNLPKTQSIGPTVTPTPTPKPQPESLKKSAIQPSAPQSVPAQPASPGQGKSAMPPVQPAVPRTTPSPPPRTESPKGRDQRTLNGRSMRQPPPKSNQGSSTGQERK